LIKEEDGGENTDGYHSQAEDSNEVILNLLLYGIPVWPVHLTSINLSVGVDHFIGHPDTWPAVRQNVYMQARDLV